MIFKMLKGGSGLPTLLMVTLVAVVITQASVTASHAQLFETRAKTAILMDAETGSVLFQKDADTAFPPASMAKIMTMEIVFDALKDGSLALTDTFRISENAWRTGGASSGGSTMFAELDSEVAISDLMRGVIVQSGNDAAIAIAEGMAGSERAFANLMTERARALGMQTSTFSNSTGLPDPGQQVTARELARLAIHIIRSYPQYYAIYSEPQFEWNRINQRNRNPLLRMDIGADGMKTGFTEESGYGIVSSAVRGGQRLVAVLSGMSSTRERAEEARKMLNWGARAFDKREILPEGEIIGGARVYGGETRNVDLTSKGPLIIFTPIGSTDRVRARITYQGPLMPPVEAGQHVAELQVFIEDKLSQQVPLFAATDVVKGGLQRQALDALEELAFGWIEF
ncbi:MAG: D-alanyl-D-alanine carboxypeptidase family protein [Pseudomonadota bacterium]